MVAEGSKWSPICLQSNNFRLLKFVIRNVHIQPGFRYALHLWEISYNAKQSVTYFIPFIPLSDSDIFEISMMSTMGKKKKKIWQSLFSEANFWHRWTICQHINAAAILYFFRYSYGQSYTEYWHQCGWKTRTSVWIIRHFLMELSSI